MRRRDTRKLIVAVGTGAVAGLRSMTAPAVVSWAIEQNWIQAPSRRLRFLKSKRTALILSTLAVGELVADKLPSTPNRTQPLSLAARAASGALSGAVLCASKRKLAVVGAALGALAAIASSFTGYTLRKRLDERLAVRDTVVAVAEDVVATGTGVLLLRSA